MPITRSTGLTVDDATLHSDPNKIGKNITVTADESQNPIPVNLNSTVTDNIDPPSENFQDTINNINVTPNIVDQSPSDDITGRYKNLENIVCDLQASFDNIVKLQQESFQKIDKLDRSQQNTNDMFNSIMSEIRRSKPDKFIKNSDSQISDNIDFTANIQPKVTLFETRKISDATQNVVSSENLQPGVSNPQVRFQTENITNMPRTSFFSNHENPHGQIHNRKNVKVRHISHESDNSSDTDISQNSRLKSEEIFKAFSDSMIRGPYFQQLQVAFNNKKYFDANNSDLRTFFLEFDRISKVYGVSDTVKLDILPSFFDKYSNALVNSFSRAEKNNYKALKRALMNHFRPIDSDAELSGKFFSRFQKEHESVNAFYFILRELLRSAQPSLDPDSETFENLLRTQLKQGLLPDIKREALRRGTTDNLEVYLKYAIDAEYLLKSCPERKRSELDYSYVPGTSTVFKKPFFSQSRQNVEKIPDDFKTKSSNSSLECYYCNRKGHTNEFCWRRKSDEKFRKSQNYLANPRFSHEKQHHPFQKLEKGRHAENTKPFRNKPKENVYEHSSKTTPKQT